MAPQHRFYSQNGEDYYLWSVLGRPLAGFFVEVGAFDGVYLSNTYALEQMGWKGVCVEPHPRFFPICQQNRPNSDCVHAACVGSANVSEVELVAEHLGIYSGVAVADQTLHTKYAALHKQLQVERINVPARTLDAILSKAEASCVDLMSVDTEGTELDVLDGLDFARYGPRLLLVEANTVDEAEATQRYLAERGYSQLRRLGKVNYAFARDDALLRTARQVVIDCELEPLKHPDGTEATARRYRERRVLREQRPGGLWSRLWRRLAGD